MFLDFSGSSRIFSDFLGFSRIFSDLLGCSWILPDLGRKRQKLHGKQSRPTCPDVRRCRADGGGGAVAVELRGNDAPASGRELRNGNPVNGSTADPSREIQPRNINAGLCKAIRVGVRFRPIHVGVCFGRCCPIHVGVWLWTESAKSARPTIPAKFAPMFVAVARAAAGGGVGWK